MGSKDYSEYQKNAIWRERIRKEEANQVVITDFLFTLGQTAVYTEKVGQGQLTREQETELLKAIESDPKLRRLVNPMNPPRDKYNKPVTTQHDLGWFSKPLVPKNPLFGDQSVPQCDITKFGSQFSVTGKHFRGPPLTKKD
eukprot:comp15081_c0_seq1/m.22477 comp15081_c0_seq1/g.22477  ORF comp15081_c0_seq1/g.22477 comp15081_c0_seq1/m.22477 type:complete len:141 (+) comp15081_c0_seq1:83-505(+)